MTFDEWWESQPKGQWYEDEKHIAGIAFAAGLAAGRAEAEAEKHARDIAWLDSLPRVRTTSDASKRRE